MYSAYLGLHCSSLSITVYPATNRTNFISRDYMFISAACIHRQLIVRTSAFQGTGNRNATVTSKKRHSFGAGNQLPD
jgi:hypothetical protein